MKMLAITVALVASSRGAYLKAQELSRVASDLQSHLSLVTARGNSHLPLLDQSLFCAASGAYAVCGHI